MRPTEYIPSRFSYASATKKGTHRDGMVIFRGLDLASGLIVMLS